MAGKSTVVRQNMYKNPVEMDGLQPAVHRGFNLRSIQWKYRLEKKIENAIYANKEIKEDLGITAGFLKNKCSLLW